MAKRKPHRPRVRQGDIVTVIAGEARGRRGRVLRVMAEKNRVVVEGVNLVFRHIHRSQKYPQGGRLRREAPIDISNVMVVDSSEDRPTRVGKSGGESGSLSRVRVSRRSGAELGAAGGKKSKRGKKE